MSAADYKAPASVDRLQNGGLFVGGVAALVGIFGWLKSPADFSHAYIFSYMLVLGLTLGSLGLLMLQHLTGGIWGIRLSANPRAALE